MTAKDFSEPMVCMRVAFHENDENDKDNSVSYKQGVECWIGRNHRNHGNVKNHKTRKRRAALIIMCFP